MSEPDIEYEVNIFNTVMGNLLWILLVGVVIVFVFLGFSSLQTIDDEYNRLLAMIVICFATVKLIVWIGHPRITLRIQKVKE